MRFAKPKTMEERRQYIRLDSVFPVRFRFLSTDDKAPLGGWNQGFTNNIGKGGICLTVHSLGSESIAYAKTQGGYCALEIEIPLGTKVVPALSRVTWFRDKISEQEKYFIGLRYEEIDPRENSKIVRFAKARQLFIPVTFFVLFILMLCFLVAGYITSQLSGGNKTLAAQLVSVTHQSEMMRQAVKDIQEESQSLRARINALKLQIQDVGAQEKKNEEQKDIIAKLNGMVRTLAQEKALLTNKLNSLQARGTQVATEMLQLDKKKSVLEKATTANMYNWLCVHQNPRTGLVMSFEGDPAVADWAFSYDQSLVGQSFLLYGDYRRAKKILEFFSTKAKRVDKLFINAYYYREGTPAEEIVHAGPNIWIGIFALQYTQKTKDPAYLKLAKGIAQGIMALQSSDSDGGIKGGPNVSWYSTEHNLDAYAFFGMLYTLTGDEAYHRAQEKVFGWLQAHTYDRPDIPVKRGKGDATIATDTYAWSLASIGPEKLKNAHMDPDAMVEFAEKNCGVEVDYLRPEGMTLRLKGFDFAAPQHVARGGIISTEWTAQMIIAYKIMAEYYAHQGVLSRAQYFQDKASMYLATLSSMIISSPSSSGQGDSCLPYSSEESVDTGHGWITPRGKTTGSVSATAYALLAYQGFNPLELKQ